MVDYLIQATISNLIVSAVLAGLAWSVQRSERSVVLSNLLWTLVLIKMVTPPLLSLPVIKVANISPVVQSQPSMRASSPVGVHHSGVPIDAKGAISLNPTAKQVDDSASTVILQTNHIDSRKSSWVRMAILVWIAVSVILLMVAVIRIVHFEILLRRNSRRAPEHINKIAQDISVTMGLRKTPIVVISCAHIAPFVWCLGGRPRIIVSSIAGQVLGDDEIRMVLAHEMAHVKRRDHWIRWIECLASVIAWWNPLLWWTRRHLRITEEVACDELVIEKLRPERNDYANTLLNMAELLSTSATHPPAVACGINSGGLLEQRLTMIISKKNIMNPTWLRPAILMIAIGVAPFGLVYAQDYQAVQRRLGSAVEAGELTIDQAKAMFDVLKQTPDTKQDLKNRKRKYTEVARKIEAAVVDGMISKQDAEKKLIALRTQMFEQNDSTDRNTRNLDDRKRKYTQVARELEAAVVDGMISKLDAEKKLIALRTQMFEQNDSTDRNTRNLDDRKRKYTQVVRELEAAVVDGMISKLDAEKKLIALRTQMFEQDDSTNRNARNLDDRKRKYTQVVRELETAVVDGMISKQDAEKKLIALRTQMFEQDDSTNRNARNLDDRKRKYTQVVRELEAAVVDGMISKLDAEKKLIALRTQMFEQDDSTDRKKQ